MTPLDSQLNTRSLTSTTSPGFTERFGARIVVSPEVLS